MLARRRTQIRRRAGSGSRPVLALLLWILALASVGRAADLAPSDTQAGVANPAHPREQERVVFSDTFQVDRIFKSMLGPFTTRSVTLLESQPGELLWLTGYSVEVFRGDRATPASAEFECHTNLEWMEPTLAAPFTMQRRQRRAFTLTQGQMDVRLPAGFGLPVRSDEALRFNSQVLNLNQPDIARSIVHRARIRFLRDEDVGAAMKPLAVTGAQVIVSLEGVPLVPNMTSEEAHHEEASCAIGEHAGRNDGVHADSLGRHFSPHWVVPPGRHTFRTLVTADLAIPYDTTIHFIGVHVHPYSESLTLRDLTTQELVFTSDHRTRVAEKGLDWIEYYSSETGLMIHHGHEYELISVYDNPGPGDADAMASMFVYYLDKQFARTEAVVLGIE